MSSTLRVIAAVLRRSGSALGDCGAAWAIFTLASRFDRQVDLRELADAS